MIDDKEKLRVAAQAVSEGNALEGPDADDAMTAFEDLATPRAILMLLDEIETLRLDAERYRFVSELAWYVDAAARTYNLCNINARWSDQRGNPDRDDVEQRIDRERTGEPEPEEDGYT